MISLQWLNEDTDKFPSLDSALTEPNGLLAAGGDLSLSRLISSYQKGIFPWYSEGEPLLWWSPNPRFVLKPNQLKISRSLSKNVRNSDLIIKMDTDFEQVISNCASKPREGQPGTWISSEMKDAYIDLYYAGYAHSVECWRGNKLVGGLYGVHSGQVFCGESMFSHESNASKIALVHICNFLDHYKFKLIDSQVYTEHLERLGAFMIPRYEYIEILTQQHEINMPKNWSDIFKQYLDHK